MFQNGGKIGDDDDANGQGHVDDGKDDGHDGCLIRFSVKVVQDGLFKQLHPSAEAFVIRRVDPNVGDHQLEREQRACGDEANDGEAVDKAAACFVFIIVVRDGESRGLGWAGGGFAWSQWLGRRRELHGRFWQGCGARRSGCPGFACRADRLG